ncbi:DinB family protein [Mucilaginibacter celer]|uniref:DinB family protein n=1 Tax=Mucilaginibacter celer TaxID=2305508 RepID=A0A494W263_9SPHI|nr:DinB family protein [Mucilaginibacter celer]AYL97638.1 DinB family protein [Mucilaginibacter celer]
MNIYPSLSQRLNTQHQAIQQLIAGVSTQQLNTPMAPGKWSALDNIAHLAIYQKIFVERMHRIINEDTPAFERYNGDLDPEFTPYRSMPLTDLLDTIEAGRVTILNLITQLSDSQLSRIGIHPRYGNLTIVKWLEFFVLHEAHHLFTIFQLVNAPQ